jgi:hypothetical protein
MTKNDTNEPIYRKFKYGWLVLMPGKDIWETDQRCRELNKSDPVPGGRFTQAGG